MRKYIRAIMMVAICCGINAAAVAADPDNNEITSELVAAGLLPGLTSGSMAPEGHGLLRRLMAADDERGCCVFLLPNAAKCTTSSEDYCEQKAKQANLKHKFYKDKKCKEVTECK